MSNYQSYFTPVSQTKLVGMGETRFVKIGCPLSHITNNDKALKHLSTTKPMWHEHTATSASQNDFTSVNVC